MTFPHYIIHPKEMNVENKVVPEFLSCRKNYHVERKVVSKIVSKVGLSRKLLGVENTLVSGVENRSGRKFSMSKIGAVENFRCRKSDVEVSK